MIPILDAATVLLMRDTDGGQFELFLMCRNRNQSFMAGAYVFPGGRLDRDDCDPALIALGQGVTVDEARAMMHEPDLPADKAMGLYFTGIRETFEEAGILLAVDGQGSPVSADDNGWDQRVSVFRKAVHQKKTTMLEMAGEMAIHFALDKLRPYSHWITPEIENKRYDTRFFLAEVAEGRTPVHDKVEMTGSLWITPDQALEKNRSGQMKLMPPTLITLQELSACRTVADVYRLAGSREIYPILPQPARQDGCICLKLPHDPEYSLAEYKRPDGGPGASRLVLTESGWRTVPPGGD